MIIRKVIIVFLLFTHFIIAQSYKQCGTDEAINKFRASHPDFKNPQSLVLKQEVQNQQSTAYVIPVVFHIIHDYGVENISDAQVQDAIAILNKDFNKQNSDTSQVVGAFKNNIANCGIEFKLATKDPNGNCTTGIDRIISTKTYIGDDDSKLNQWPPWQYMNVWVVNSISLGAAGYTYLPGTTYPQYEGIMMLHDYVGSIGTGSATTSRILTHEVGHFLNLEHTWGSGNNAGVACGDDYVSDTPITEGWINCNVNGATCGNAIDNVQNFMEYSYCSKMFTNGQKNRMVAALNASFGYRSNLWGINNLNSTGTYTTSTALCAPVADFKATSEWVCENGSVTFSDLSWRGTPTNYQWYFDGGSITSSTLANPVVQYNVAGMYSVTLVASNSAGSSTSIKSNYIKVQPNLGIYSGLYTESFESGLVPGVDWRVESSTNNASWQLTTQAGYTGSKSAFIDNYNVSYGEFSELISPGLDISNVIGAALNFKYAYAQKSANDDDKLEVYVSANCGQTWTLRFSKTGSALTSTPLQSSYFVPTSGTQWKNQTVNISPVSGSAKALIKFKFSSGGGNNIYVDDVNISGTVGINKMQMSGPKAALDIESGIIHIWGNEFTNDECTLILSDALGRILLNDQVFLSKEYNAISTPYLGAKSGIYFLSLYSKSGKFKCFKLTGFY